MSHTVILRKYPPREPVPVELPNGTRRWRMVRPKWIGTCILRDSQIKVGTQNIEVENEGKFTLRGIAKQNGEVERACTRRFMSIFDNLLRLRTDANGLLPEIVQLHPFGIAELKKDWRTVDAWLKTPDLALNIFGVFIRDNRHVQWGYAILSDDPNGEIEPIPNYVLPEWMKVHHWVESRDGRP